MSSCWDSIVSSYETFAVFLNREPWLSIRRVLWVVTAGWVLATSYVVAAFGMIFSIVFIPFAPTALRFAWCALLSVRCQQSPFLCTLPPRLQLIVIACTLNSGARWSSAGWRWMSSRWRPIWSCQATGRRGCTTRATRS